eukprot:gnl/TRDRNA2_/TRDRNA2_54542_c0_seq1.p1 gnl/TRDRNA2_/TRDRNA2_54542_c0~~gnl/TRDRNA2_/TRDRNA2_54542_c0_seq1.p1  ORF type:complete len:113 (-),score=7.18 gnl/TRDRNA2_/TRDRNA2_54542_c0_seq1:71-409(-)
MDVIYMALVHTVCAQHCLGCGRPSDLPSKLRWLHLDRASTMWMSIASISARVYSRRRKVERADTSPGPSRASPSLHYATSNLTPKTDVRGWHFMAVTDDGVANVGAGDYICP